MGEPGGAFGEEATGLDKARSVSRGRVRATENNTVRSWLPRASKPAWRISWGQDLLAGSYLVHSAHV